MSDLLLSNSIGTSFTDFINISSKKNTIILNFVEKTSLKAGLYDKPYLGRNRFSVIITGFAYT